MKSIRKAIGVFSFVLCLLLLTVRGARAQETADIVGTVTDSSGAVLPGANVTLTNTGTNVSQTAPTSASGDYVFTLLQVGTYTVKVEMKGFKTYTASAITIAAGDRARVDAKMEVGDITQTVEVSGTVAPALQTDTSTIGSLVPSQSVEDLPLNQRNIIKLVQLSPGATEGQPGSIAAGNRPDDRRMTSALSVNGQDDSTNQNMIDGFDNNTRIIGTIGVRPSIDAIQEVSITTNKYDASVGRTGGGVVEIVTKAGTNDIHGSAFEFFRNKVLNGNPNWNFNEALNLESIKAGLSTVDPHDLPAPNPAFRQNQYGGSVGGPIIKNKTFFFVDYEDLAYANGLAAAFYTVPTYCEHGMGTASSPFAAACPDGGTSVGDFSDNPAVSLPGTAPTTPGGKWGGGSTTLCSTAQYGTSACPYVVVPQNLINPTGLAFFNMYPLPNTGSAGALTNNYTAALVRIQNAKTIDGRIDEHFSDKDSLFGHITYNGETTINPNGFPDVNINPATGALAAAGASGALKVEPVVTSYAGPNNEDQYFFGLSHVHVFSPSLVLNLKAGVMRSQILSFPANQGTNISTKLGIPCTATACVDYANSIVGASGLVHASIRDINSGTSYTTIGDTTFIPLGYWDTSLQYFATLTWNKGSHSVRYGLGLIRRRAGVGQSNAPQGQFNFNGSFTGQAMGDLLEGLSTGQSRNNALVQEGFRSWEPSGYIQDDWRARSWLTLNLGVRYDIFTPYTEVHGRITNYDPYNGLLVGPSLPGLQQTGPTDLVPTPYSDIAPRFGFAATLKGNMVLRGGFGLTFMPQNYESQYYFQNAPFDFASSCTLQNNAPNGGSNSSCLTSPIGTYPIGEFGATQTAIYGTPTSGSTKNSSTLGQQGGTTFANSLPVPVLLTALATNTALYAGTTIQAVPPNLKEAYLEQFNLQLQKQFGNNVVTAGYVGELGRHLANFLGGPFNQNVAANPVQANGGNATLPMSVGGATNDGFGTLPGFPYLATADVGETPNTGTSAYNALQATFVRRFGKGLTVNINYTWSHSLDNFLNTYACTESMFAAPAPCWVDEANGAGPSTTFLNATDPNTCAAQGAKVCRNYYGWQQYAWGNSPNDVQDRIAWGVDYALPFGNSFTGVSGAIVKGWSTNVSGSWQTGLPFTATPAVTNTDTSGGYADQTCSGKAANPSILDWFNYNCFINPTPGTLGDERAGSLMGPHQKRLDFSLFKTFNVNERVKLQFRTEVFNLFNQTNFGQPSSSITFSGAASPTNLNSAPPVVINAPGQGSHTTGEITAASGNWNPRQIQFALKVLF
ncbi:MAG TPA: TonB-dependent receptor [Candidatus Acidoferrales bacterium]